MTIQKVIVFLLIKIDQEAYDTHLFSECLPSVIFVYLNLATGTLNIQTKDMYHYFLLQLKTSRRLSFKVLECQG